MSVFPWARHVFSSNRQVVNRILIVGDGEVDFCDSTFGLTELCSILTTTTDPWDSVDITTAHRSANSCKGADILGFTFDMIKTHPHLPFSIENYDQVWLFGHADGHTKPISPAEVDRIVEFMEAGGGVFATGDHRDLGVALCGEIPRVRSMRMWRHPPAPDRDDDTRLDTLRQGTKLGFKSTDQSDGSPQEIRPRFSMDVSGKTSYPHPLLRFGDFAVTVLPDHMHEGECKVPTADELRATYEGTAGKGHVREYPESPDGSQVKPQVVAISTSAGGFVIDESNSVPTEPRAFAIIVAYDGHEVRPDPIGRVAVDASFHHFVNLNLKGTGSPGLTGFYDLDGNPTEDYKAIKRYFRNIASWLKPPNKQKQYYLNMLVALRYMSPLIEEVSTSSPYSPREILFLGTSTRGSISERLSNVDAILCALTLADTFAEPTKSGLRSRINPWPNPSITRSDDARSTIDPNLFVNVLLGSAMITIARSLPSDSCEVGAKLDEIEKTGLTLRTFVGQGLKEGVAVLGGILNQTTKSFRVERLITEARTDESGFIETVSNRKDATMATKCTKTWKSVRTKNGEETENARVQVFDDGENGFHEGKNKSIKVKCKSIGMTWDMDDGDDHFHYDGKFVGGDEDHVKGNCSISRKSEGRAGNDSTEDTEEWEGTKTGT